MALLLSPTPRNRRILGASVGALLSANVVALVVLGGDDAVSAPFPAEAAEVDAKRWRRAARAAHDRARDHR